MSSNNLTHIYPINPKRTLCRLLRPDLHCSQNRNYGKILKTENAVSKYMSQNRTTLH